MPDMTDEEKRDYWENREANEAVERVVGPHYRFLLAYLLANMDEVMEVSETFSRRDLTLAITGLANRVSGFSNPKPER